MPIRTKLAALMLAGLLPMTACGAGTTTSTAGTTATASSTASSSTSSSASTDTGTTTGQAPGGPGGVDVSAVSTEAQLVALVQQAYGDAGLDLHRGHQAVQDVLDEVLSISHDELHVRMEAGQNLAAVATELGLDPQVLVDALVASWSPAIDQVLASGEITEAEAEQYRQALEEAFVFRTTWDGAAATPTFTGLAA